MTECVAGTVEGRADLALREGVTQAAAVGFIAGGVVRLCLGGFGLYGFALRAVAVPFGAVAVAVAAGIVVNLLLIPALCRLVPGRALPVAVYGAAGALCWLAAFAGAYAQLGPPAA